MHNFKYSTSRTCSNSKASSAESRHRHKILTCPFHYKIELYWYVKNQHYILYFMSTSWYLFMNLKNTFLSFCFENPCFNHLETSNRWRSENSENLYIFLQKESALRHAMFVSNKAQSTPRKAVEFGYLFPHSVFYNLHSNI